MSLYQRDNLGTSRNERQRTQVNTYEKQQSEEREFSMAHRAPHHSNGKDKGFNKANQSKPWRPERCRPWSIGVGTDSRTDIPYSTQPERISNLYTVQTPELCVTKRWMVGLGKLAA